MGDASRTEPGSGARWRILGNAFLVYFVAGGFATMLLSMVMLGCGFAFVFAIVPKTIGSWFPPVQLGMANGLSLVGLGVGQGVAALPETGRRVEVRS